MVTNLINSNGRAVANQFVITNNTNNNEIIFQSYNSTVCAIRGAGMGYDNVVVLGKDWNYSNTTRKHLYEFLRQNGLEILASNKAIEEALDRGHARMDESIAVWLDVTL